MMAQLLWALALGITPLVLAVSMGQLPFLRNVNFRKAFISHCVHTVVSVHPGILWNTPKQKYTVTLALLRLVSKT